MRQREPWEMRRRDKRRVGENYIGKQEDNETREKRGGKKQIQEEKLKGVKRERHLGGKEW